MGIRPIPASMLANNSAASTKVQQRFFPTAKHRRKFPKQAAPDAEHLAAREARLRYVNDNEPGYSRKRSGRGFAYFDEAGKRMRNPAALKRIASLAIPPAYTEVWICPHANGHIQATGRDARGRKQYRYHPRWREVRDESKYGRMLAFGAALPCLRRQVARDLALPGMPRRKVLATLVRLLEITHIRVGNQEYQRSNHSFGLTTLRNRHVEVKGSRLRFEFTGKGGKLHNIAVADPRIAKIVRQCQDIPGQQLFQYLDEDGERHSVISTDINAYLQEISGGDFTAKDFRTWSGTLLAARELRLLALEQPAPTKQAVMEAIRRTAGRLGNTAAICRKCYIHPEVLSGYLEGSNAAFWQQRAGDGQREEEKALLKFLKRGRGSLQGRLAASIKAGTQ